MLHVTLFVELLRSHPWRTVWAMALVQAALWTLVPTFFYAAPPGQLPEVIAIGHEFRLGSYLGPPLAFWLANLSYIFGKFGIYALSQTCIVVTYWSVFRLGCEIVGPRHAAFAVVLMGGIVAFTVPTPEFGPAVLATALWSLALLHYWRAAEQQKFGYWSALGLDLGLLLLTTYASIVLVALLLGYMLSSARGRDKLTEAGPWIAAVIIAVLNFPLLVWLDHPHGAALTPAAMRFEFAPLAGLRLLGWLVAAHVGLVILVLLGYGFFRPPADNLPAVERTTFDPDGRKFVYVFALAPAAAMTLFAMLVGGPASVPLMPLAVLSGLAVMATAPDHLPLVHQRLAAIAWAGLVVLPPLLAVAAVTALPWILPYELAVTRPAGDIGRFFADSFQRRTGKPLAIVTGDEQTAALVALGAPSRPSVYFDAAPERTPWISQQDIESKGAIVVWPTNDTTGAPPPAIKARFPELIPDVPRVFDRRVQGFTPPVRIGWGVIRPRGLAPETPPPLAAPVAPPPPPVAPPQPQPQPKPKPQQEPQTQSQQIPKPPAAQPPAPPRREPPRRQQPRRDPMFQW